MSSSQNKENYDRLSRFYDYGASIFEKKYRGKALECLEVKAGETVLEIGFGTGRALKKIAKKAGKAGAIKGLDISPEMYKITEKRLKEAGLLDRVELCCGDALEMTYENNKFDKVFMSFTLELFAEPEILKILQKIKKILKSEGRLVILYLSKGKSDSLMVKIYKWAHKKFPEYIDCRPIFGTRLLQEAGFKIMEKKELKIMGIPLEIVIAEK